MIYMNKNMYWKGPQIVRPLERMQLETSLIVRSD